MHMTIEEVARLILDLLPGVLILGIFLAFIFGGGLAQFFEMYVLWVYG